MSINSAAYIENLEQFIQKLHQELDSICRLNAGSNITEIDRYILELNRFYYKSFHQEFFPAYQNAIHEEIAHLLEVNRQEGMIKKDILANLKRYAQLYNQVKHLSNLLKDWRLEINTRLADIMQAKDQYNLELLYPLKSLGENVKALAALTSALQVMAHDRDLQAAINDPSNAALLRYLVVLDTDQPKTVNALNHLQVHISLIVNLLDQSSPEQLVKELNRYNKEALPVSSDFSAFYQSHIYRRLQHSFYLLAAYHREGDRKHKQELVEELTNWLSGLLVLIEKRLSYIPQDRDGILTAAFLLSAASEPVLTQVNSETQRLAESLDRVITELTLTEKPDFAYFAGQTLEFINPDNFQTVHQPKEILPLGPLVFELRRVTLELDFLYHKTTLLQEKHQYGYKIAADLDKLLNMVDSHLNRLSDVRSDLERLLAPRNLSRVFKDLLIRVERVPIEKGQPFPREYLHLLDKYAIETRITEQESNIVLHEEGDIFIFRVAKDIEEEVPPIIVSQKGI